MTPTTLLLRHAHPNFMDGDQITSQVFMPFPKVDGCLSVYKKDCRKIAKRLKLLAAQRGKLYSPLQ